MRDGMLYITYEDSAVYSIGIFKKVRAQYRVFKKTFINAYYTLYSGQIMHLYDDDILLEKELAITKKDCNEIITAWITKYKISNIYVRHYSADRQDLIFYRHMEEMGVKVIVEFPGIHDSNDSKIVVTEDIFYRNQIQKYVKCCTTYSDMDSVYGIPCIVLSNGVDINEQPQKKYRKKNGTIVLLAVAAHTKWHGYERVIKGLYEYYLQGGERNIVFNLAGNGGQLSYYGSLVKEYNLQDHINFCGVLRGTKLDEIYDNSDIAVGSLGFYKVSAQSGAPIKLREYCARGIPFVYGYDDLSFDDSIYYAKQVPNNASPINMNEIIAFYDELYDGRDFIKDMRKYAVSNLTWDKILQPVIGYYLK